MYERAWNGLNTGRNSPRSSYVILTGGDGPGRGALLTAPCHWGEALPEKEDRKTPTDLRFLGGWLAR